MEAAAAWWLRLQNDPPAEFSGEYQGWMADPRNARAFQAVGNTMSALDSFGASPPILKMRQSALRQLQDNGIRRRFSRRMASAVPAAAVLLVAALAGGYYYLEAARTLSYRTDIGERRAVTLADGSHVSLDSGSEVDIRFSKEARAVTLTRGRARFDVAHDTTRPFAVTAGTETVVAVGTAFDVEMRGPKVLVTLIQGHVLVRHAPDAPGAGPQPSKTAVPLSAGQQMVAAPGREPAVAKADLYVTQAWEAGHLVFRGEPLADAVEQVNRYTDHPIHVDPSAASIRISGVFNAGDVTSFVTAITEYFPVAATADAGGAIMLQKGS